MSQSNITITHKNNPYTKRQTEWFVKNGFGLEQYDWTNKKINYELKQSISRHNNGFIYSVLGVLGSVRAINRYSIHSKEPTFLSMISLGSFMFSALEFSKARRSVQDIEWLRIHQSSYINAIVESQSISSNFLFNPYSKRTTDWMIDNGLNVDDYHWGNQGVTHDIEHAVKLRRSSHIWGFVAIGFGLFLADDYLFHSWEDDSKSFALLTIATSSSISIIQRLRANANIKKVKLSTADSKAALLTNETAYDKYIRLNISTSTNVEPQVDINMAPFAYGQKKWLTARGFYWRDYDWKNEKVNKLLRQAVELRSATRVEVGMSALAFLLGIANNLVYSLNEDPDKIKPNNHFFWASGGILLMSGITFSIADGKVNKAIKIQRSY